MSRNKKPRILVIEDDKAITLGLSANLGYAGYEVDTVSDGREGLRLALDRRPDLIILDLMLPGMSGYEICRRIRAKGRQTPILMLTARQEEFDKLHGFEVGADDYVTKPFSVRELLARVRALLARGPRREDMAAVYRFGEFELDMASRTLTRSRKGAGPGKQPETVPLTRTECDLLACFCRYPGKALSRQDILDEVWGADYYGTQRSLDSFVAMLRAKIEKNTSRPRHILTVHGVGYKFESDPA